MEFILTVFIGLAIAAFMKDMFIDPYFKRLKWEEQDRIEKRVAARKASPRMTDERARQLLGIKEKGKQ